MTEAKEYHCGNCARLTEEWVSWGMNPQRTWCSGCHSAYEHGRSNEQKDLTKALKRWASNELTSAIATTTRRSEALLAIEILREAIDDNLLTREHRERLNKIIVDMVLE